MPLISKSYKYSQNQQSFGVEITFKEEIFILNLELTFQNAQLDQYIQKFYLFLGQFLLRPRISSCMLKQ